MGLRLDVMSPCNNTWTGRHTENCGHKWEPSWLTKNLYDEEVLRTAWSRGYDDEAHRAAIVADETGLLETDAVTRTHPFNWLTEKEVSAL